MHDTWKLQYERLQFALFWVLLLLQLSSSDIGTQKKASKGVVGKISSFVGEVQDEVVGLGHLLRNWNYFEDVLIEEKYEKYIVQHLVNYRYEPSMAVRELINTSATNLAYIHRYPYITNFFDVSFTNIVGNQVKPSHHFFARRTEDLQYLDPNATTQLIYMHGSKINTKMKYLSGLPPLKEGQRRVLVMAGSDNPHLSSIAYFLGGLRNRLSHFFIETKDVRSDFVKALPMGFTNFYLANLGLDTVAAFATSLHHLANKRNLVCAAWGAQWSRIDNHVGDRAALRNFISGLESRGETWLHRQLWPFSEYLRAISQYVFFVSVSGMGIQSPKLFEALLAGTIPIVTRNPANEDLLSYGFPIIMLDHWEDLTEKRVKELESAVRYPNGTYRFNWESVHYMLSVNYSLALFRGEMDVQDRETQERVRLFNSLTTTSPMF